VLINTIVNLHFFDADRFGGTQSFDRRVKKIEMKVTKNFQNYTDPEGFEIRTSFRGEGGRFTKN
jgi:hypothetical protein